MSTDQPLLPLDPTRPVGALARDRREKDAGESAAREPRGVEVRHRPAREVLHRASGPFPWAVDPYLAVRPRGVRRLLGRAGGGPRVVVEDGAQWALLRTLSRRDLEGEPIALGDQADPYLPAPGADVEERLGVTRSLLETLTSAAGLTLSLTTRSPLVLRDLDLLAELDRRHAVTVNVPIPALDAGLVGALEPAAPAPAERLRALAGLAAEGLTARLLVRPLAPAINDAADVLEPLLAAARDAGAVDAVAHCLELRGADRARFLDWLAAERPRLVARYRSLYGRRGTLRQADKNRTLKEFHRLRLAHGFPRRRPGRG
jgi:DNA repair photolyase